MLAKSSINRQHLPNLLANLGWKHVRALASSVLGTFHELAEMRRSKHWFWKPCEVENLSKIQCLGFNAAFDPTRLGSGSGLQKNIRNLEISMHKSSLLISQNHVSHDTLRLFHISTILGTTRKFYARMVFKIDEVWSPKRFSAVFGVLFIDFLAIVSDAKTLISA